MNTFLIFLSLLTIAYIVYLGIVISQDIIAEQKKGDTTTETIEVSSMNDERIKAVEVQETSDGFRINYDKDSTQVDASTETPAESSVKSSGETPAESSAAPVEQTPAKTTEKINKPAAEIYELKESMEETECNFGVEMSLDQYDSYLNGVGAKISQKVYTQRDGDAVIVSIITPDAFMPVAPADENENIIEDNSQRTGYDHI